ncbi:MAG: transposase [Planctomycetota bacterium]
MRLSPAGRRASWWWMELARRFPLSLDSFVVMPNHLHGIVVLHDSSPSGLADVVRWFKTMTTNEYIRRVHEAEWARFPGRLWLRGYYDHVIRHSRVLDATRAYIRSNPGRSRDQPTGER